MATVIDISILNSMSTIIVFVIVFIGSWGMMMLVDPFKEKGRSFYGILAFMLALLLVISKSAVAVVLSATPWLMVIVLIGFFFIFFAKMFGVSDASLTTAMKGDVKGWLVFLVIIVVLFSLGSALGPDLLAAGQPGQPTQPSTVSPGVPVIGPNGSVDYTGTTPIPGSVQSAATSSDFGSNLILTIFHPKILGILFMFLLGTLAIIMLGGKP